jgi:hypothetical protein
MQLHFSFGKYSEVNLPLHLRLVKDFQTVPAHGSMPRNVYAPIPETGNEGVSEYDWVPVEGTAFRKS